MINFTNKNQAAPVPLSTILLILILFAPIDIYASRISAMSATAISTNTPGAGNFIWNQSTLQSGATFNVSSGTVAGQLHLIQEEKDRGVDEANYLTIGSTFYTQTYGVVHSRELFLYHFSAGTGVGIDDNFFLWASTIPYSDNLKVNCDGSGNCTRSSGSNDTFIQLRPSPIAEEGQIVLRIGSQQFRFMNDGLRFHDNSPYSKYVALKASSTIATSQTFVLPDADGSVNNLLITNGTGDLSFADEIHLTDSKKIILGISDDYTIEWDGDDAVHTITAGDFMFMDTLDSTIVLKRTDAVQASGGIEWKGSDDQRDAYVLYNSDVNAALTFGTGAGFASTRVTILDNGYMGVGTTAPGNRLEIVDSGYPVIRGTRTTSATNLIGAALDFNIKTTGDMSAGFGGGVTASVQDDTAGPNYMAGFYGIREGSDTRGSFAIMTRYDGSFAEKARITAAGRFGLGITNPSARFHMVTDQSNMIMELESTDASTDLTNGIPTGINILNVNTTANTGTGIDFSGYNASSSEHRYARIIGQNTVKTAGSESGELAFFTRNAGSWAERVRIKNNGDVGLGDSTPGAKLEVRDSTDLQLRLATSDSTFWDIGRNESDGNFEIEDDALGVLFKIDQNSGNIYIPVDGQKLKRGEGGDVSDYFDGSDWIFNSENITADDEINFTNFSAYTFDNVTMIGDGGSEHYTEIKASGEINLHGTARVFKNVELTPANVGKPSTNPPDEGEYQGFQFHRFDRGTEEQVYYLWHVPDDFATGNASVKGHFGFFVENPPSGGGDEAVVLGFEYKKISPGDTFDFSAGTSEGTLTTTITDGEAAYKWHETAEGMCTTTGWAAEDIILFRFYRDATNVNDTYDNEASSADNDVWVGIYHLQYLSDKLGKAT